MVSFRHLLVAFLALALAAGPAAASGSFPWLPWYPLVDNPNVGTLSGIPNCDNQTLANQLTGRFNDTEFVYWGGFHRLEAVEQLSEQGARERGNDKIARRWCTGTARFADGARRKVVIELAANADWLGLTYSLTYCIMGLDRGFVHGRDCEGLRKRNF